MRPRQAFAAHVRSKVSDSVTHVASDSRRFERPLSMELALAKAEFWWHASEVRRVFPDHQAVSLFHSWLRQHNWGRKRLLDTMLAATYCAAGIDEIITSSATDFSIYQGVRSIVP